MEKNYRTEKKQEPEESNLIIRLLKQSRSEKKTRMDDEMSREAPEENKEEEVSDPISAQIEYLRKIARKYSPMARE